MDTVILMGTGPRDWNPAYFPKFKADLETFVQNQLADFDQYITVVSGGAQGFDIALAKASAELNIPFRFLLPNPTYLDYYYRGKGYQKHYLGTPSTMIELMRLATSIEYVSKTLYVTRGDRNIHSNFVRNDAMVEAADLCVAGFDRSGSVPMTGGTGYAVRAALDAGLDVYNQEFVLADRPMPANDTAGLSVPF